jgi:hypothetical protein
MPSTTVAQSFIPAIDSPGWQRWISKLTDRLYGGDLPDFWKAAHGQENSESGGE